MTRRLSLVFALASAFVILFFGACERPQRRLLPQPDPRPRPQPVMVARGVLSAPVSVTVDFTRTFVVWQRDGGGEIGGALPGVMWTDLHLFWQHPDPAQVDYYEVYTTTNVPYFSVPVSATLALTTTAQGGVFLESPDRFNPIGNTTGFELRSDFDFYAIRAVNSAGASAASVTMGIVNYSMFQSAFDPANPPVMPGGDWPTPRPTAGPSPTPIPTATRTPVPTGTAGPSPTP